MTSSIESLQSLPLLLSLDLWSQLGVALLFAVFWAVALHCMLTPAIRTLVAKQSWWPSPAAEFMKRQMYNYGYPEAGVDDFTVLNSFAAVMSIAIQHGLSATVMLPAVFLGWEGCGFWGRSLFVIGSLSDIGWDIQDAVFVTLGTLSHVVPVRYWILMCVLHHPLALMLSIPMNMYYIGLPAYHRLACSLLFAASISYLTGQFKMTLDTSSNSGALCFKAVLIIQLLAIVLLRTVTFFHSICLLLMTFYAEASWLFFSAGCCGSLLMSAMNLVILKDVCSTASKWLLKPLPEKSDTCCGALIPNHDEAQEDGSSSE